MPSTDAHAAGTPLITLRGAAFGYGSKRILENVDFTLARADFVVLVGENGAGKSTFVEGLLGLKKPVEGTRTVSPALERSGVGYLAQANDDQKDFPATVREVVTTGLARSRGWRLWKSPEEKTRLKTALLHFGLSDLAERPLGALSGGQRRRALIARAFVASEELLVLDEPTAGLDTANTEKLLESLIALNRHHHSAIVLVTHDQDTLERLKAEGVRILEVRRRRLVESDGCGPAGEADR